MTAGTGRSGPSGTSELSELFQVILEPLSAGARERLVDSAEWLEVAPGARVFDEGGVADALHVVVSGTVQLSVHQRERNLAVASVGPGELLGWSWMVPPHRWDFDAASGSGATLVRIPADVLRSVMEADPRDAAALSGQMLGVVSRRLRDTRIQLLDLFSYPDVQAQGGADK